ncbi:MAG: hypothetical protein P1P90_00340 [Patescibacteria group bacterium]|nr:hypothetical protein [Patescibacteria group bacterium]
MNTDKPESPIKTKDFLFAFALVSSILALPVVIVFGVALYIVTPQASNDVATGDYQLLDSVIEGKEDPNKIPNRFVRAVAIEFKNNLQNGTHANGAMVTLEGQCKKVCSLRYQPGTMYCSTGRCFDLPSKTVNECRRPESCTDDMQENLEHVQALNKDGWLSESRYPVYMEQYKASKFTVWQKTFFSGLVSSLLFFYHFYCQI